jgi:hypothetical protein
MTETREIARDDYRKLARRAYKVFMTANRLMGTLEKSGPAQSREWHELYDMFRLAQIISDMAARYAYQAPDPDAPVPCAPVHLASCGHPADEDGECDCAWWPEPAPVAPVPCAPVHLASCGHPADEDGECDCAWWPEPAPVAPVPCAPVHLASCGHPADEDGECDCAWWPEPAPVAERGLRDLDAAIKAANPGHAAFAFDEDEVIW